MSCIVQLPEALSNQIAAGEVVERPASVVKELVENSMDAGAKRIDVDIGSGGIGWVCVTDDGSGMDPHDTQLALQRHATSKITTADDLLQLNTFGFRGEALPSIASVSKFELCSRRADDNAGTQVISTGDRVEVMPFAMAPGTIVQVRDLFYNVPARRKFLKSTGAESAAITSVLEALALSNPRVAFHLNRDRRVVRNWLRAANREQRAIEARPDDQLRALKGSRGPLMFEAYLSPPDRARTSAISLTMLINGRVVKDRVLARLICQAYGSVLPPGRYPVGVVYIDVDPALVDVNVHPQKAEVRFADVRAVHDAVFRLAAEGLAGAFGLTPGDRFAPRAAFVSCNENSASTLRQHAAYAPGHDAGTQFSPFPVRSSANLSALIPPWEQPLTAAGSVSRDVVDAPRALTQHALTQHLRSELAHNSKLSSSELQNSQPAGFSADNIEPDPWGLTPLSSDKQTNIWRDSTIDPCAAKPMTLGFDQPFASMQKGLLLPHDAPDPSDGFGQLRFVAQLRRMYLLCESSDGVVILDQHAAAERVTFYRYRTAYLQSTVVSQRLLIPCPLSIDAEQAEFIEQEAEQLQRAGMVLRVIGPGQAVVTDVPQILAKADPAHLARDILDEMASVSGRGFSGAVDKVLATMACHGSIRAGDDISTEQAQALLQSLDEVDFSGHCPHGRPILMRISYDQLDKLVGRK